jgi:hypothetical protein
VTGDPLGFLRNSKSARYGYLGAASVSAYAAMHNDTDIALLDANDHPPRTKHQKFWRYQAIREYLPFYEWVLWMDSDAVIANYSVSLAELSEAAPDAVDTFLIVRIVRLAGVSTDLNNGVFMIRNHPMAYDFLSAIRDMVHVRGTPYMDQGDFGTLLNKEKCVWKKSSPAAPSDRFFNNTWFQDRGGLLLQHYARPCKDYLVNPDGEWPLVWHYPGDCGASADDFARPRRTFFPGLFAREKRVGGDDRRLEEPSLLSPA